MLQARPLSTDGDRWQARVELVDPTPSDTWKRYAKPVVVNEKLAIVPAWMDFRQKEHFPFVVSIDPEESLLVTIHDVNVADLRVGWWHPNRQCWTWDQGRVCSQLSLRCSVRAGSLNRSSHRSCRRVQRNAEKMGFLRSLSSSRLDGSKW